MVEAFGSSPVQRHPIATGPFILEHYEPNVKIVFKRNAIELLPMLSAP